MVDLIQAQVVALPYTEPVLIGAVLVGAGGSLIWFARTAIETRDAVRRMAEALYDDTTGLIKIVYQNRTEMRGALGQLSNETVALDKRVTRVEDRCKITHTSGES